MQFVLNLVKRLIPKKILNKIRPLGHGFLAYLAAMYYGFPSSKMVVIGITGTAGKSTTIQMLASILNANSMKCGYTSTVSFFNGNTEIINKAGMSMAGRFTLQKNLKQILDNGCKFAIIESTSEGLAQNRHWGINFDIAAIINLSQAHLDAHGGFENYKKAKGKLFSALEKYPKKTFFNKKIIFSNLDNQSSSYFLSFNADQKYALNFGDTVAQNFQQLDKIYEVKNISSSANTQFDIDSVHFNLNIPGEFNARNAAFASAVANVLGVSLENCAKNLTVFSGVTGRMQFIANAKNLRVVVDYAPEPVAMENVLTSLSKIPHKKLIHVFGSTGGHRDVAKRFQFGEISAKYADTIIITNDDVYESDPQQIAVNIREGIERAKDKRAREIFTILDRREALKKSLEIATSEDIVVITGKGSEQFLVLPGNKRIDWDDAKIIRELV